VRFVQPRKQKPKHQFGYRHSFSPYGIADVRSILLESTRFAETVDHALHLGASPLKPSDNYIHSYAEHGGGFGDATALNVTQEIDLAAFSPQLQGVHDHSLQDTVWG
jgi:hypothetical protein